MLITFVFICKKKKLIRKRNMSSHWMHLRNPLFLDFTNCSSSNKRYFYNFNDVWCMFTDKYPYYIT